MFQTIIVEDDPMVASINGQYLKADPRFSLAGTFSNGRDALAFMENHPVDLAIVDYYMPLMNGIEFIRTCHMKEFPASLIMITAASTSEEITSVLANGVLDYMIKPFTYERFQESLQKFIHIRAAMEKKGKMSQADIDQLISRQIPIHTDMVDTLVKGIQPQTLDLLRNYLLAHKETFLTSDEISKEVSLSRITIRRYLNYLLERHEITSLVDYHTGGRPSLRYKIV